MSHIRVKKSAIINAPPEAVYAIISDYRVGHPAILPKPYFKEMIVEEGGSGAGTVVRLEMEVFGSKSQYRQIISEPEPGRVLVEGDYEKNVVTTFTIDPVSNGKRSRVLISTEMRPSPGVKGFFERILNPLVLRRIYTKELQNLEAYVGKMSKLSHQVKHQPS